MNEDPLHEQAEQEYRANVMDTGLWARAMSEVDGDEERARRNYIALRVAQLEREQRGEEKHGHDSADEAPTTAARESVGGRGAVYGVAALIAVVVLVAVVLLVL
jgi:hypothetical protein